MLLNDLLKLFSTNFNINEERLVEIIEANNIKLSQRLLLEIKTNTKISTSSSVNFSNKINDTLITNVKNNDTVNDTSNDETDSKKKETSGRGRGRPRKTKDLKEESSVLLEVEVLVLGNEEYYKTRENVVLNKELEIEGIYVDGKISRRGIN